MASEHYDRVELGRKIKRMRQSQDLTANELAKRSGVSAGYLSEVERGLSGISIDKLRQIATGLDVAVEALLGESEADDRSQPSVEIPAALSKAAEQLNLSYRATITLLQGQRSLTARRSKEDHSDWSVEDWIRFHDQVREYLLDN